MMRLFLILLALVYLALPASAQTVQVRSGNHTAFARLTLDLPARVDWTIDQQDRMATISFNQSSLRIDTSQVFRRIPSDRISSATWNDAEKTLVLSLDCACDVSAFWHEDTLLVIDVSDDPDPPAPQTVAPSTDQSFARLPRSSTHAAKLLETWLPEPELNSPPMQTETHSQDDAINRAEAHLLETLNRAASQGLVTPRTTPNETFDPEPTPEGSNSDTAASQPETRTADYSQQLNVHAQSSIDTALHALQATKPILQPSVSCISEDRLKIADWGTDGGFAQQVGELRLQLSEELDGINHSIAIRLSKLYLYFGFGAEAADILNLLPEDHADKQLLLRVAEITDQGYAVGRNPFKNQLDCDSSAAFWAALSHQSLPDDQPIHSEAILRSLNALPPHLRSHFGPTLSRRFTEANKISVALQILRILDRSGETTSADISMAKATIDAHAGHDLRADAKRTKVIEEGGDLSVFALIDLINSAIANDKAVTVDQARLAAAYAFEYRDDEIALEISKAHIRALAASGDYQKAFERLRHHKSIHPKAPESILDTDVYSLLEANADDITFLKYVLGMTPDAHAQLTQEVQNQLGERLLRLGFPREAASIVKNQLSPHRPEARTRQILLSKIALEQSKPQTALAALLSLKGDDVDQLRVQAKQASDSKAGTPTDLERSPTTIQPNEFADQTAKETPNLAQMKQLVTASESIRRELAELIQATALPSFPLEND